MLHNQIDKANDMLPVPKQKIGKDSELRLANLTAIERWQDVANELGLTASEYKLTLLRARLHANYPQSVTIVEGACGDKFILKLGLNPKGCEIFEHEVVAHLDTFKAFQKTTSNLKVPRILYHDISKQIMLMEFIEGFTAHDSLVYSDDLETRKTILRQSGQWIRKFHDVNKPRHETINPDRDQKRLTSLITMAKKGQIKVPGRHKYIEYAETALGILEEHRGKKSMVSTSHGDMNLRNLIIASNGIYGFDFNKKSNSPIGRDIARYLVNFGNFFFRQGQEANDWFSDDTQYFFEGYGAELSEDPSIKYYLAISVLREWAVVPKKKVDRNYLHDRRWEGVQRLAKIVF